MTLPADHEFWRTHMPPNGWGCSCYVVGARSERGAKRVGGDPQKTLPDGWDARDRRTGAPDGIDKGWDYAPGASVAREVGQVAKKVRQWEYQVAKGFMLDLPPRQRDALAHAYRALPSTGEDARRYAERALRTPGGEADRDTPYRTLGLLTSKDVSDVAAVKDGLDLTGYDYAMAPDGVRHIRTSHGELASERLRGQRAVTPADYARLPLIVSSPDRVEDGGKTKRDLPAVTYYKTIAGELYTVGFAVQANRRSLVPWTMWIRKA